MHRAESSSTVDKTIMDFLYQDTVYFIFEREPVKGSSMTVDEAHLFDIERITGLCLY